MLKNASYQEKFELLSPWMPMIIETIKKDLKHEHLKKDLGFCKKYLANKNAHKATTSELSEAYKAAILEGSDEIGEFVTTCWLIKNSDIYDYFESELQKMNPNFQELENLEMAEASKMMNEAVSKFGPLRTYVFSVLNSVVFPKEIYHELGDKAAKDKEEKEADSQLKDEKISSEQLQKKHDQEIARLTDKYEKKLSGLQKKYFQDVESLKKQIASLQRKLTLSIEK